MKKSKNYQKIISQLEDLYVHVSDMAKIDDDDSNSVWIKDKKALQEAIGIIDDYEKATEQTALLVQRYEVGAKVIHRDLYIPIWFYSNIKNGRYDRVTPNALHSNLVLFKLHRDMDIYVCPNCGRRARLNHTYCHWCGKKLLWESVSIPRKRRKSGK